MGRLSWINRWCGCNHSYPNKKDAGVVRGEGDGMMEAEAGRCRKGSQAREHRQQLEAEMAGKFDSPLRASQCQVHTLTSAQWKWFQSSDLQTVRE